jgi:ribonuclease P protein component
VVRLRAAFDRKEFISASSEKLKAAVRAELQQLLARAAATTSAGAATTTKKARP